ncbi:MAG: SOS response-associated peptidase family protein, partial [Desulfovibrio sp.]|nr:SOS response-associated peptidase family protein [Desulfovibrio sp.]
MSSLGDISPTNTAPALVAGRDGPLVTFMAWGFTQLDKHLVINARSETAWEKPLFREDIARRRCVLPAVWFYEWDQQKRRNTFYPDGGSILLLAGFFNEAGRFVILTTAANTVMRPVHDRMPVCLAEKNIQDWLMDAAASRQMLKNPCVSLRRKSPIQQGSLWG